MRAWLGRNPDFAISMLALGILVFLLIYALLTRTLPLTRGGT